MSYSAGRATQQYKNMGVQSKLADASPYRLIQMLMDGALDRMAIAKGQIVRKEIANKTQSITRAIGIIDGLRMSLDHSVNPELSRNLENLYDYMNRRLLLANVNNDCEIIDEVMVLLRELKEAWDAIPPEMDQGASEKVQQQIAVANA